MLIPKAHKEFHQFLKTNVGPAVIQMFHLCDKFKRAAAVGKAWMLKKLEALSITHQPLLKVKEEPKDDMETIRTSLQAA